MTQPGTTERPLRVAIVGSGPSAFYAAESLVKSDTPVRVDMFERLALPYGLVRYGVAPDHQKIKSVVRVFERIAQRPNVHYFGNVNIGEDITVDELHRFYDAVLFATGAQTDRRLGIPGEDMPGSHTATEFVAWYNGHPQFRDREFDLTQKTAVVIGNGNVAVDVCRILGKTVDELRQTDIADYALDALAESRIETIYMVGRRGPVQAKFTPLEIKELGRLEGCAARVHAQELELEPESRTELEDPKNKLSSKTYPLLQQFLTNEPEPHGRVLRFLFRRSPVEIEGGERVEAMILEKNRLEGEPFRMKAIGTGERETLPCGLVFRSVGYRGVAIPGVPFDEANAVIPNDAGRVHKEGKRLPGIYVAGWIKRGPTGIIGTNKPDAHETATAILQDAADLPPCTTPDTAAVLQLLDNRGVRVVSFDDWLHIDTGEQERGAAVNRPRHKFTSTVEVFEFLDTNREK